jgi:hypothetical protein
MELKFSGSTDKKEEIELESSLIHASWLSGRACAGQTARFEVSTAFVGDGAKIKLNLKNIDGKSLGKISDTIKANKYVGEFEIPEDTPLGEVIYFEVSLPNNGLDGESDRIKVFPPVRVTNLKWSAKEARRGDILTLSADVAGLRDYSEVTVIIYEYDRDKAHDRIVAIPATVMDGRIEIQWEYQYHEDTDEIASQEELDRYGGKYNPPEYFFTVEADGTVFGNNGDKPDSGLLEFMDWVEIRVVDRFDRPLGGTNYSIRLPDGTVRDGEVNEEGYARVDDIGPGKVRVRFPEEEGTPRVRKT